MRSIFRNPYYALPLFGATMYGARVHPIASFCFITAAYLVERYVIDTHHAKGRSSTDAPSAAGGVPASIAATITTREPDHKTTLRMTLETFSERVQYWRAQIVTGALPPKWHEHIDRTIDRVHDELEEIEPYDYHKRWSLVAVIMHQMTARLEHARDGYNRELIA